MKTAEQKTLGSAASSTIITLILALVGAVLPVTASQAVAEDGQPAATPTTITLHGGWQNNKLGDTLNDQVCDFDNDGYADLSAGAISAYGSDTFADSAAYRQTNSYNDSYAALPNWNRYNTSGNLPSYRCIEDINGDGLDDHLAVQALNARFLYVNLFTQTQNAFGVKVSNRFLNYSFPVGTTNLGQRASTSAGDVDGDEFNDFVVSQDSWSGAGRTANGRLWVMAGIESPTVPTAIKNLTVAVDSAPDIVVAVIEGAASGDKLGTAKAVGDVNSDGFDDMLVASPESGKVWLIYGQARGDSARHIDLANIDGEDGVLFAEQSDGTGLGSSLSVVDDLNGDGINDYLLGTAASLTGPGGVAVVFGSATPEVTVVEGNTGLVTKDGQASGYWVKTGSVTDGFGYAVAGLSDYNGDDLSDLLIGAPGHIVEGRNNGAAYIVFGKSGTDVQDVSEISDTEGYRLLGSRGAAQPTSQASNYGSQVARIGDIDGNGVEDFAIGASGWSNHAVYQHGAVFIALRGEVGSVLTLAGSVRVGDSGQSLGDGSNPISATDIVDLRANLQMSTLQPLVGRVSFKIDGEPIPGCEDVSTSVSAANAAYAECTNGLTVSEYGDHEVTVHYAGETERFPAVTSDPLQIVVKDTSKTSLTVAPVIVGNSLKLVANVAAEHSTTQVNQGTVSFVTVNGVGENITIPHCDALALQAGTADCELSSPEAGAVNYRAIFSGIVQSDTDSTVEVLASSLSDQVSGVVRHLSSPQLSLSDAQAEYGKSVTAAVTVPVAATGEIAFTVDGQAVSTAPVSGGKADYVLPTLSPGTHTVHATYSGDTYYAPGSSSSMTLTVSKAQTVLSAPQIDRPRQPYGVKGNRVKVTVSAPSGGKILFRIGKRNLGEATIINGNAFFTLPANTAVGSHQITATYAGDNSFSPTQSAVTRLTVMKAKPRSIRITKAKYTRGSKPKVTIKVGKLDNGSYPVGKLKVKFGSTTKTVKLKASHKGKVVVTGKKSQAKLLNVRATFTPNKATQVKGMKSAVVKVKSK